MANKKTILFVCIHNSARSQMAEAFINNLASDKFFAQSAGLEPGRLNPNVVTVMKEVGLDLSGNKTKSVKDFIDQGREFDYVVTVCDDASAEKCPIFPGNADRIHWGFEDPSRFGGSDEEKLQKTREVRDKIKSKIEGWVDSCG